MTDSADLRERRGINWPVAVLLAIVAYVLLLGPLHGVWSRGYMSEPIGFVYSPVSHIGQRFEPLMDGIIWYIQLFEP